MINKKKFKDFFILTFTTRKLDSVWKYPHMARWLWLPVVPLFLGTAYHYHILNTFVVAVAIGTILYKFFVNYYVSKHENPSKVEQYVMYGDCIFFGLWSGVLGFYITVVLIVLSFFMANILFYGFKRIYITFSIYSVMAMIGWFSVQPPSDMLLTYGQSHNPLDVWMFAAIVFQFMMIGVLLSFTMQAAKKLERNEKSKVLIKNDVTALGALDAEQLQETELLNTVGSFVKEKFSIKTFLHFVSTDEGGLEFNETCSVYSLSDSSFLNKMHLSTVGENSIFNFTFRKNLLYFHIKNEKSSSELLEIFEKFNAQTIILYPIFSMRKLKGVFFLMTEERDYLNHNFQCYLTEYVFAQFVLLRTLIENAENIANISKSMLMIEEKKQMVSRLANRYLNPEVIDKFLLHYEPEETLNNTGTRKRILIFCLDLRLLKKKKFADMEILKEFYEYIFPQFVKIAKNYDAKLDCICAERLVAYWEEDEGSFKETAKSSTLMAMEMRELLNIYFGMRLKKTELQESQVRILLYMSYVTFLSFGNENYSVYTYYSQEGEKLLHRSDKYPGNIIICDEAVHLFLKNEIASEVIHDEANHENYYLLMLSAEEKNKGEEYCKKINEEISIQKKVKLSKKIQMTLNPSHKSLKDWFHAIIIDLFTSKNIDSTVRYAENIRWSVIPFLIGIFGILHSMNRITPLILLLMFFTFSLKFIQNFRVARSDNPFQSERVNALIDSAIVGFWTGITSFPLLLLYFTFYIIQYPILFFGVRYFLNTVIIYLSAITLGLLYEGYHFEYVYPVFYDIYFLSLLLILFLVIPIIMHSYRNIIQSVKGRAKQQKSNIKQAMEFIHEESNIVSENALTNMISGYFNNSLDIKAALYYQIKEDDKFWLKTVFCNYISEKDKDLLNSKPLCGFGDDNIFMNTYKQGVLYFQLFEKSDGHASDSLLAINDVLKSKQLIIYSVTRKKMPHGLIVLASDADNIINDNLKLLPLTLAATGFNSATDSIRLEADYRLAKETIAKIEKTKNNLFSSVKSVLRDEIISLIFDPVKAEEYLVPRKRLVAMFVDISAYCVMQADATEELKGFYQRIFDSYYSLTRKYKGKADKAHCDTLIAYWEESQELTFKDLTKAAILFAQEFRDTLQSIDTKGHIAFSFRILVATNYVTVGSFGNEKYKEYAFINPTFSLLLKEIQKARKSSILCDEATYLLVKDTVSMEALTGVQEEQKLYYVVVNDDDKTFMNENAISKEKSHLSDKLKHYITFHKREQ